jgi:hypothetical protein
MSKGTCQRAAPAPASRTLRSMSPDEARPLILGGHAPEDLQVRGTLDLSGAGRPCTLPTNISVWSLKLNDLRWLRTLPSGLNCNVLELRNTGVESLPADFHVELRLELQGCTALRLLPRGLKVGVLNLRDCTALTELPEGLECNYLDISGCTALRKFPKHGKIEIGNLLARSCRALSALPPWLTSVAQLDISGCVNIQSVPGGLQVSSWIDVGKSGIQKLPEGLQNVELRWRGVPVSHRIAFQPETITADEVLAEENVELRRAMLDSMGFERFLNQAGADVLDTDRDTAGGERTLLRVPLKNDEDLVCVSVRCPSTRRQYLLRVPPTMKSCRQAVAWTAGFDDAKDYRPTVET